MKKAYTSGVIAVAYLLIGSTLPQAQESQPPWPPAETAQSIEPQNINCQGGSYSSGAGPTFFHTCISDHGNVIRMHYPAGAEHIEHAGGVHGVRESYGVCHGPTSNIWYYDFPPTHGGFAPPVVVDPAPFPVTIRRTSTDGVLELDQKFVPNKNGRVMTITMTVRNISPAPINNVLIARGVDPDMDGLLDTVNDRSSDHAWARNNRSLVLATPTANFPHHTAVHAGPGTGPCSSPSAATPVTGDFMMRAWYEVGTIGSGKKKSVTFRYNGA